MSSQELIINIPTRKQLEDLKVGDLALDCFGHMREIKKITTKKEDIHGRFFCHYHTKFGDDRSTMSMSQKEGVLTRTVHLSTKYTSRELDTIEQELLKEYRGR
jgi:hypothetical protein